MGGALGGMGHSKRIFGKLREGTPVLFHSFKGGGMGRHGAPESFVQPNMSLGYCENVLHMFFSLSDKPSTIDPLATKALDLLFILHI